VRLLGRRKPKVTAVTRYRYQPGDKVIVKMARRDWNMKNVEVMRRLTHEVLGIPIGDVMVVPEETSLVVIGNA
jgi:hypothetical protein